MTISQFTLPQNFFDITSSKLLRAPRAEFPYAKAILAALGKDLEGADGPMGHIGREITGAGGTFGPLEKDALILAGTILSDIFTTPLEAGFKGLPGTTVRFNRPKYDSTVYTLASREIGPTQSISTVPITASSEQASITLKRYAGPYDSINSRVAPYGIDKLSAQVGVHRLPSIVGEYMKYDYHRWLDAVAVALLDVGAGIWPSGFSADNDITAVGIGNVTYEQLMRTEQEADDANLPTFSDGFRVIMAPPAMKKQLALDTEYQRASEFHPEMNAIFPSYFRSVGKFHLVQSTTLTSAANSSNVTIYKAHMICPGVCGVASGDAPRVAYSNDDNYGETAKLIWVGYHAFANLDSRFVRTIHFGA